ncbi:MAG: hypothetical protein R2939_12450 [Kofleriaceae bacterium]
MRTVVLALLVALAVAGCPRQTHRGVVPAVPTDGDGTARARFVEAQRAFEAEAGDGGSAADFAAIAEDYPDDPIATWAQLYAGQAYLRERAWAEAAAVLEEVVDAPVDAGLIARGSLLLGFAQSYLGDHAGARRRLAAGERAIETEAERAEWLAATASAFRPAASRWRRCRTRSLRPEATSAERAYVLVRVAELVEAASLLAASAAWRALARRDGPSAAVLGEAHRRRPRPVMPARRGCAEIATVRTSLGLPLDRHGDRAQARRRRSRARRGGAAGGRQSRRGSASARCMAWRWRATAMATVRRRARRRRRPRGRGAPGRRRGGSRGRRSRRPSPPASSA